jgi:F-type H+-transporting ATPase subunit gamma
MAKARAIIKRRKSVQNIKKITRTMELIATARFKKALDRASEAAAFTRKIGEIVADLGDAAGTASHPLLEAREPVRRVRLLVITSNRGLAGAYNGSVLRAAARHHVDLGAEGVDDVAFEVSGKRGVAFIKFKGFQVAKTYTHFDDRPKFGEVEVLADEYARMYRAGEIDRLDVAYTRFHSASRQEALVRTLLPMSRAALGEVLPPGKVTGHAAAGPVLERAPYEFLPDARTILDELVPVSFKVQLFKCFLDAAVSEQIARMVAMKGATENAEEMIRNLTRQYNRARQSQITRELAEIIGGAAALE